MGVVRSVGAMWQKGFIQGKDIRMLGVMCLERSRGLKIKLN